MRVRLCDLPTEVLERVLATAPVEDDHVVVERVEVLSEGALTVFVVERAVEGQRRRTLYWLREGRFVREDDDTASAQRSVLA